MRKQFFYSLVFFLSCFSVIAQADILHLKSGAALEGEVVQEREESITFEIEGGQIDFLRSEIDHIEKTKKGIAKSAEAVEVFQGEEKKDSIVEKVKAFLSPDETKTKGERTLAEFWSLLLLNGILSFLFAGFMMKLYFQLCGEHVSYWSMVLFQLKVFFLGILVGTITGFLVGFGAVFITKQNAQALQWVIFLAFAIGYSITYYVRAKKDLDVGFIQAFVLALVIGLANLMVAKGLELSGLGITPDFLQLIPKK